MSGAYAGYVTPAVTLPSEGQVARVPKLLAAGRGGVRDFYFCAGAFGSVFSGLRGPSYVGTPRLHRCSGLAGSLGGLHPVHFNPPQPLQLH